MSSWLSHIRPGWRGEVQAWRAAFCFHTKGLWTTREKWKRLLLLIWHSHGPPFFSRKETQVKHSQVLTEPRRQFPPSVKWLKPSPAEQLPAFSQHPPPTDTPAPSSPRPAGISHNPSAGRRSLQNGQDYGSGPGYNLEVSENESQSQKTLSFDLFFLWCVTSHVLFTVLLKRDSNINLHIF